MSEMPAPPLSGGRKRWFAILAITAGCVASLIAVEDPPGINVVIIAALMGAAVSVLVSDRLPAMDLAVGAAAFVFISMFAVRNSELLLFADFCAAAGLGSYALYGGTRWSSIVRGGVAVLGRLYRGFGPVVGPIMDSWRGFDRVAKAPLFRGSAIGLVLVVVFGFLFASADTAFAQIAQNLLIPSWDLGLLPVRLFVALVVICFTGAYASVATAPAGAGRFFRWSVAPGSARERRRLQVPEWVIPIALVNFVFAAFVLVQMAVLFGGQQHVLDTAGLTYAEYARSGFFQLVVIAALVLGVIALAVRFADTSSARERTLLKGLLGALCVLTLVVLASALRRLGLYEEAFGFTRLRFFVHVSIFWLSAVFVAIIVAGIRWNATWLPRVVVWLSVVTLLGVNLMNPDAFVARQNLERYVATGKIDAPYLRSLGPDAVPVLVDAPADIRSCLLAGFENSLDEKVPFWSLNLGRERAQQALASIPSSPLVDCPV
jgi:hypothetical protein